MRPLATLILTLLALGIGGFIWQQLYRRYRYAAGKRPSLFPIVLTVGVLCRLAYIGLTPVFYAPDEQSHFNYIKFLAEQGEFPVQTAQLGDPGDEWEHNQPPLYYLTVAPFYSLAQMLGCNQTVTVILLRGFSIFLWLLNVWFGVTLLNCMQITDRVIRTFFLSLICLLPTYTFTSAVINNDNLLATLGGALLCLLSAGNYSVKTALFAGLLLGLALLTKQSAVVFVPLLGVLPIIEAMKKSIPWPASIVYLCLALGSAFLIYLPWAARNWQVYHTLTPEFLTTPLAQWPSFVYGMASAAHNLMKTFWAVSGVANDVGYPFPLVGMLFLVGCWSARVFGLRRNRQFNSLNATVNLPLLTAFLLGVSINVLLVLRFGYLLGMGQGRHLFPLLFPIALVLGSWLRPIALKKLEVHAVGCWILYAVTFAAYSLARFPR